MMEFRRRWSRMAVVCVVAACGAGSAFAAPTAPPDPAAAAAEMKSAKGPRIAEIRNDIVAATAALVDVIERNKYAERITANFEPLVGDVNPDVKLNSAMTIAQLHTLSTDTALERMLADKNPAVRYWAAKGLGDIINLKLVGAGAAIKALNNALAVENSALVKKEILRAIVKLAAGKELVDALLAALDSLNASLTATAPDQETLEAVSFALAELHSAVKATPPDPKDIPKIAKTVTWTASLISQQEVASKEARSHTGGANPEGYHPTVVNGINGAMQVLDDVAGKSVFPRFKAETSPEEVLVILDGVTGSAGLGGGQVQKVFPDVAVPPKIKPAK